MVAPGILVVDKPPGLTSHDVVARARRLLRTRRVGHAGTLDPMATGVLVLGVEWGTRLLTHLTGHDKAYAATVRLGASTVTDDAEGEVTARADASDVDEAAVAAAVARLRGDIEQVPAAVSAVKVGGERAYRRVRSGEQVDLPPRRVRVAAFDVLALRRRGSFLDLDVRVEVSAGTYVRALARDLGADLGVGGHLTALRRLRSGPFAVEEAVELPRVPAAGRSGAGEPGDGESGAGEPGAGEPGGGGPGPEPHVAGDLAGRLLDLGTAARRCFPVHEVDAVTAGRLRHGQRLPPWGTGDQVVAALDPDGMLVALVAERDGAVRPLAVVPAPAA